MRSAASGFEWRRMGSVAAVSALTLAMSCGANSTATTTTTTSSGTGATNPYAAAYMAITNWGSGVTVSFPTSCTMTVSATGVPPSHNAYYLAPAGTGQSVVTTTASGIQLAVTPYTGGISTVNKIATTFNICPAKASSTTATQGGAIGFVSSGEVLFDPYEATNTVALGDNVSYTFMSGGTSYTAYFLDQCNSHPAGGMGANSGSTWHYHGVPTCWTATVDGATGRSHIIGVALDGYPIYGGRDINGNAVAVSSLDACNGITSATPEFPNGAYHYVLPLNTTTAQSSMGCYAGTVGTTTMAWAQQMKCKQLMAMVADNGGAPRWVGAMAPLAGSLAAQNLAAKERAAKERGAGGMEMAGMSGSGKAGRGM